MKWPTINWKPPKSFTDEDSQFSISSESFDTWHSCKTCVMYCVVLALPAIYFQWWWIVPILAFVGLVASSIAGAIEQKAGSGYPYLESGDAMGLVFAVFLYFIVCVALFWGSFSMPADGWDKVFTGPSSSAVTTATSDGETDE